MARRKIYVASSWRNEFYPEVVEALRADGHEVYDFRNPPSGDAGFKWSTISEDYMDWSPQEYREQLNHPKAIRQFANDIEAMEACDTCVLVLPCGRSAHTEAGWFAGRGKQVVVNKRLVILTGFFIRAITHQLCQRFSLEQHDVGQTVDNPVRTILILCVF